MPQKLLSCDQWRAAGRQFSYRGHAVFYRDSGGDKPALLLIHGFPTASWDFYRVWDVLAQHYRLLAPDLIGFGFSDKPRDYVYSLVDQAALCASLCAQQGLTSVQVLAHDYGVSVAQELIAQHEEGSALRLRSVAFLNGGLFPESHRPRLIQKLLLSPLGPVLSRLMNEQSFRRSFSAIFGPDTQPDEVELKSFWQLISHQGGNRIMHKLIRYMRDRRIHRARWVAAMQKTRLPMRLINGPVDPVSGAHLVTRYRELIANADTVSLPGIGHYPQVEAPEQVLQAFFEFQARI